MKTDLSQATHCTLPAPSTRLAPATSSSGEAYQPRHTRGAWQDKGGQMVPSLAGCVHVAPLLVNYLSEVHIKGQDRKTPAHTWA